MTPSASGLSSSEIERLITTCAGFVLVIGGGTAGAMATEAASGVSVLEEKRSQPSIATNARMTVKRIAMFRCSFFMTLPSLPNQSVQLTQKSELISQFLPVLLL